MQNGSRSPRSKLQRYRVSGNCLLLPTTGCDAKQTKASEHHGVGFRFGYGSERDRSVKGEVMVLPHLVGPDEAQFWTQPLICLQ